jgi:transposase
MGGLKFERVMEKETFEQYLSHLEDLRERIKRMEKRIEEVAQEPDRERVQKLRAFRGIDYLTALALVCEIGDFRRFPSAGAFMSYLGLVPGEFSSGTRRNQGGERAYPETADRGIVALPAASEGRQRAFTAEGRDQRTGDSQQERWGTSLHRIKQKAS